MKAEVGNAPGAVKVDGLISSLDGAAETADDNNVRTDSEMYVIAHNIMDAGLDPSEQAPIYRGAE